MGLVTNDTILLDVHPALHNAVYDVKAHFGAKGDGVTDDTAAIQNAIYAQQLTGGIILFSAGTYPLTHILVPSTAISTANGTATYPCVFKGSGMYATTLKRAGANAVSLIGIGRSGENPVTAPVVVEDMTLDGNYDGVAGGAFAAASGTQLVSLNVPFTKAGDASTTPPSGIWHYFRRVRFYRPTGYGFQPSRSADIRACLFHGCGQPDLAAVGPTHYDDIGGGVYCDTIAIGNTYKDCSGNFIDLVATSSGKPSSALFAFNRSYGHQIGGVYAANVGSVIMGNTLANDGAYSAGVGYDAATDATNRSKNMVVFNTFTNINVNGSGLSSTYGDFVDSNIAADAPQGTASITVTASPFTYTAGPTREAVYIRGGTVSDISKNSRTIFTASEQTVVLGPGEAVIVTYSGPPTMEKDRK